MRDMTEDGKGIGRCGIGCRGRGERKVPAVLVFKRQDLLDDIENYAYVEGHVMADGVNPADIRESQHMLIDITQEGNEDRVTRVLAKEHAKVRQMLYPYTKSDVREPEVLTSRLRTPKEYVVEMLVPEGFSVTTLDYLQKLIHEYLVCMVLWDWMCITNPKKAEHWLLKAQAAESEIRRSKDLMGRRVRRPPFPF